MIKREENNGKVEMLDMDNFSMAYSILDDLAGYLADTLEVNADVPIRFVKSKIDHKLRGELIRFGCPEDLAGEIVLAYGSEWTNLES